MSGSVVTESDRQSYLFGNLFPHSITMGFSGVSDGNMSLSGGGADASARNRERFLNGLDIDISRLVCAKQVHGDNIVRVTNANAGQGAFDSGTSVEDCDALITDKRRVAISVMTADCLSVFLYDAQNRVIALVHAGWRGTRENITGKTVQAMMEHFDCRPENIYAGFGPSIRNCCCEVSEEFKGYFSSGLESRDGRYFLDLSRINRQQLLKMELKPDKIFDSGVCTMCGKDEYFSYRREGDKAGRTISVIMMR